MRIVCTGSIAYDYLMTFPGRFKDHILPDRLDVISLSFLVDQMVKQRGGVAPNIAYTIALLGGDAVVMGTVGEDFEEYRQWLVDNKIDTSGIKVIPGKYTASFFANTDLSNNQIASFYTGAMADAASVKIKDLPGEKPAIVLISPNDPGAMDEYVKECQALKIPYIYDPSQQVVRVDPKSIRWGVVGAYALFVNEYEFELIQRATGMDTAGILKHVKLLVVTLGEKGARIYADNKVIDVPAVEPCCISDPTGVGDAFRGGFLTGWRLKLDWETCGRMGALAATYCLEQRGPQNHHYTREQFVTRYSDCFGESNAVRTLLG